ncbi:MAG: methyl-accepting chemotaxis protein [Yoonia sp.]|uniref:methyl-accepting chemotaxis protein n=1 Tax=Yoonia sp. TaxID=2212373 RepID=UPI003EF6BE2E
MSADVIISARKKGQTILLGGTIALAAVPPLIALMRAGPVLPFFGASVGLVLLAFLASRAQVQAARLAMVTALMTAVMLITAALAGHPWQLDSHMLYFAALAGIIVLVDLRALILGTALVAVQHIVLSVTLPTLIYPMADLVVNLERAALHGVILVSEAVALGYAVWLRLTQSEQAQIDQERVLQALSDGEAAQAKAAEAQQVQADIVKALRATLTRLADRDLSGLIDTAFPDAYDGLRTDYNTAILELSATLATAAERAVDLANGANEITEATLDLSRRTESQAATLEETAAAIDQITSAVRSAADGSAQVEDYVAQTREKAKASGTLVGTAVSAMSGIEKQSGEISSIVSVIDDIAFQINLLSLNAGVEAARAGEAGRGFAVVASEVRDLAQRSAESARDIKGLINGTTKEIESGARMVAEVGTALTEIITRVEEISRLVGDIARGSAEQAQGLGEVNSGIASLDQVTQQNAAMVEQCTAATQLFGDHAKALQTAMDRFTLANPGGMPDITFAAPDDAIDSFTPERLAS